MTYEAPLPEMNFALSDLCDLDAVAGLPGLGFTHGAVTTPPGWSDAYGTLVELGCNSPASDPEHGGMGLAHGRRCRPA